MGLGYGALTSGGKGKYNSPEIKVRPGLRSSAGPETKSKYNSPGIKVHSRMSSSTAPETEEVLRDVGEKVQQAQGMKEGVQERLTRLRAEAASRASELDDLETRIAKMNEILAPYRNEAGKLVL